MRFNTYQEVYDFIYSQKDRVYSLDNFRRYMESQGNIQHQLRCIHVGGTNGKGSTTTYLRQVLNTQGYKVGTFTSPALMSRLDVTRIDNQNITGEFFVEMANKYVDSWLEYEISLFEIEVFIAIQYFLANNVDFAIFEVGLGGNLDATNIIQPLVSLNTNIGLDHQDYLGMGYENIAKAKAGIIKDNTAFITGETKENCLAIFKDVCQQHNSPMLQVGQVENVQEGQTISYTYKNYNITLNTPALYQVKNSALALEALLYLKEHKNIIIDDENIINGFYTASWPGRFEILRQDPLIIVDGAHNREGVEALYNSAKKYNNLKIIFSALRDKETDYMIETMLKLTDDVTITQFEHPRAQTAKLLARDYPVKIEEDYIKAIEDNFNYQGTLLITGSLYFISKVRSYIQNKASV